MTDFMKSRMSLRTTVDVGSFCSMRLSTACAALMWPLPTEE